MTERKRVFRGDRLRDARLKQQLTQDELAERAGMGQGQMNKYENGKSDPSLEVIIRLSQELDVSADWLLGLVDDPISHLSEDDLSTDERRLLAAYRSGQLQEALRVLSREPKDEQVAGS